ncbi:disulfide bond formation protein DsbB [Tatumella sp. TA1]|uniref:disulfide bond formation protein DsbB n=1 Tax=Rosenbergiella collisarenosi TaxID=1544695 RepID=UPI0008F9353D|nr:disulfide bond formation protein DsbB [Rosenbergiella collisarenosi]MBT0722376.1 disulfide bond formation protein DsbB [Rosenbergiella collisarenosi]QGX91368.1 disulfide bond formation protein DsbB [Tatumella sp. TA1]
MLRKLKHYSHHRGSWLLLAAGGLGLELAALCFQLFLGQKPCVLCVYQRAALAGLVLSALVGVIAPKTPLRIIAIVGWLLATAKTFSLAWEQTQLQLHPPLFATCDFFPKFPHWLPLNHWFPVFFTPTGNCTDRSWEWLSLTMPQWLLGISGMLFIIGLVVLAVQLPCPKKKHH